MPGYVGREEVHPHVHAFLKAPTSEVCARDLSVFEYQAVKLHMAQTIGVI